MSLLPSPFLTDLFQDAGLTPLPAHTGGTVQWQRITGIGGSNTAGIVNNGTLCGAAGLSSSIGVYAASVLPRSANYRAAFTLLYLSSNNAFTAAGLRFDTSATPGDTPHTGYVAGLATGGTPAWQLYRIDSGSYTLLHAVNATVTAGQTYTLIFEANGSALTVSVNGAPTLSATDATYPGPGRPALWFANTSTATTGVLLTSLEVDDGLPAPVYLNDFSLSWQGDSLSTGYPFTTEPTLPHRAARLLRTSQSVNFAKDGKTAATILTENATTMAAAYAPAATRRVPLAVLCAGPNDLHNGARTAPEILRDMALWHAMQQATGYHTVALTVLPGSYFSSGENTERLALNAAILAGHTGADLVLDAAADPMLANHLNEAFYHTDHMHLNSAGKQRYAELVATGILRRDWPPRRADYYL